MPNACSPHAQPRSSRGCRQRHCTGAARADTGSCAAGSHLQLKPRAAQLLLSTVVPDGRAAQEVCRGKEVDGYRMARCTHAPELHTGRAKSWHGCERCATSGHLPSQEPSLLHPERPDVPHPSPNAAALTLSAGPPGVCAPLQEGRRGGHGSRCFRQRAPEDGPGHTASTQQALCLAVDIECFRLLLLAERQHAR